MTPDEVVQSALNYNCDGIAYTYNQPSIFIEFARDVGVNQPELPGIKSLPKDYTWTYPGLQLYLAEDGLVGHQWKGKPLVLPRLDPQCRGMSGVVVTGSGHLY